MHQWIALHVLEDLERDFDEGREYVLMQAIEVCAMSDLPMPDWRLPRSSKGPETFIGVG